MRLEWSIFAMDDRNAIFDYIEADSPQAAVTVDDRIEEQVERLLQFPEMGRTGRIEGTRELVIQHPPILWLIGLWARSFAFCESCMVRSDGRKRCRRVRNSHRIFPAVELHYADHLETALSFPGSDVP